MQDNGLLLSLTLKKKRKKESRYSKNLVRFLNIIMLALEKKNWTNVVNKIVPIQINRLSSYLIILNKTTF